MSIRWVTTMSSKTHKPWEPGPRPQRAGAMVAGLLVAFACLVLLPACQDVGSSERRQPADTEQDGGGDVLLDTDDDAFQGGDADVDTVESDAALPDTGDSAEPADVQPDAEVDAATPDVESPDVNDAGAGDTADADEDVLTDADAGFADDVVPDVDEDALPDVAPIDAGIDPLLIPPAGWLLEPPPWISGETNWITGETNWITGETNWLTFPFANGQVIGRFAARGTFGADDVERATLAMSFEGRPTWYKTLCDPCVAPGGPWEAFADPAEVEVPDGAMARFIVYGERAGAVYARDLHANWHRSDSTCDVLCAADRCAEPVGCDCGGCEVGEPLSCGDGTIFCGATCTFGQCANRDDTRIPESDVVRTPSDSRRFQVTCEGGETLTEGFDGGGSFFAFPMSGTATTCQASYTFVAPISGQWRVSNSLELQCYLSAGIPVFTSVRGDLLGSIRISQFSEAPALITTLWANRVTARAGELVTVQISNASGLASAPLVEERCTSIFADPRRHVRVGTTSLDFIPAP